MTTEEVRTIVSMLRLAACDPDSPIYGSNLVPWIDDVTTAWLADHPADDDEPVTEAWLRSVGIVTEHGRLCLQGTRLQFTNFQGWNAWWGIDGHPHASSRLVDGVNTRGQFRRLLTALGIELNPPPA